MSTSANCDHKKTKVIPSGNKTHHSKMVCSSCNKWIKWMPKPAPVKEYNDNHITYEVNPPGYSKAIFGRRHVR